MFWNRHRPGGFELNDTATLLFVGTRLEGAEIEVNTHLSIADLFEAIKARSGLDGEAPDLDPIYDLLLRHIRSWNLELKGRPVPLSRKGIRMLSRQELAAIMEGWTQAVVELPAPLGERPADGPGSPEADENHPE